MDQLFSLPHCVIEEVSSSEGALYVVARSHQDQARCPDCEGASCRVHSTYVRTPHDLPICGQAVRVHLRVRRFRCLNPSCARRTFAEPLPELLPPRARRTSRLTRSQQEVGLALSAEAAARLLGKLHMTTSADTVLRSIRAQVVDLPTQARVTFKGVHALRHASGRDETGDLALVADHLRHSSLDTARGYAKANNVQLKRALGEW